MATEVEVATAEVVVSDEREENGSGSPPPAEKKGKQTWLRRRKESRNGEKSKKPPGNKWLQQQIPACRPVFTGKHVFFVFVIIGVIFVALGIAFIVVTLRLDDIEIDYTDCGPLETDADEVKRFDTCEKYLEHVENLTNYARANSPDCHCRIQFTVRKTLNPPWYVYYSLENYFQNHRRYVNSWDPLQLRGDDFRSPSEDCRPITSADVISGNESDSEPVVPCGLIANSWFNDSFDAVTSLTDPSYNITCCDREDIAWSSDKSVRFENPGGEDEITSEDLDDTAMPPNWNMNLSQITEGLENESLIVWYRVSAFPVFRKLYGRMYINGSNDAELPEGEYNITITYNYPVGRFDGHKSIVLAEVSWLGGRNLFLGIAYLVTGVAAIIAGVSLLLVHLFCSRWKTTDKDFMNRKY